MTSHIKTIAATSLLLALLLVSPAEADPSYGVVHDLSSGTVVRNTSGNCVRTKWLTEKDVCPHGITLSQEDRTVYFEFAKSNLTPEAKIRLNSLIAKIKSMGNVENGMVVGYADRIGKPAANQKLSERRVETVRSYLAAHGLIMTTTVTRWLGDTVPTTSCPADLPRKRLIQCLQNDRRVEVDLVYDP